MSRNWSTYGAQRAKLQLVGKGIARVAARQHGLVTAVQLGNLGLHRGAISYRVRGGTLHRIHPGVFAVGHPAVSKHAHWLAAVLAVGDGAALGYLPAASLLGMWRRRSGVPHVVWSRHHRSLNGVVVHQSRTLTPGDITVVERIPVTTVPRTLLDLGDVLTAHQLANVMHEAAYHRMMDVSLVREQLARACGRRAQTMLAHALDLHEEGSAGTRSAFEDRALTRLRAIGAPEPLVNTRVNGGGRMIEVDLHWPQLGLIVEIDGPGHDRTRTGRDDARRDRGFTRAGWRVERWSPRDLQRSDAWLRSRLFASREASL